jgi:hypothetical protein
LGRNGLFKVDCKTFWVHFANLKSALSAEHLMCEPHDGHGLISCPNTSFYYGIPSMARRGFLRTPHVLFVALDHLQQRPLV